MPRGTSNVMPAAASDINVDLSMRVDRCLFVAVLMNSEHNRCQAINNAASA